MRKPIIRLVTCGSVDDGKSTLIGRLLVETDSVPHDTVAAARSVRRSGSTIVAGDIDFSLLTDGLEAEREQGITIDVAYRYFATPKRSFIIADCPGHIQYTRNMITGASNVDLAIVLIDARTGVIEQTRRHAQHDRRLIGPRTARQIEGTPTEEIAHRSKTARTT